MSVNRNVNIIKAIQPDIVREQVRYNFPADIYAVGAGGGGESSTASNSGAGGGGGAGMVVSSSISVVPNITWTINVGGGGVADTDGGDTLLIAYDDNYNGLTTLRAQGGKTGNSGAGGNSGSGSLETTAATSSYSAFVGGANVTGGGRNAAGGGAGSRANGNIGDVYDGNPGTGNGGDGGTGFLSFGGIAGGGGGGIGDTQFGGAGAQGGGGGGQLSKPNGDDAVNFGGGGGGAYGTTSGTNTASQGFDGTVIINFEGKIGTQLGELDIAITNGTSAYDEPTNTTTIEFNSGSGTFRYTAPFPYVPGN